MARFRFIGRYTNGHTSIFQHEVLFVGHEPSEVPPEAEARLSGNVEYERVADEPEPSPEPPKPRRRGRPRKNA